MKLKKETKIGMEVLKRMAIPIKEETNVFFEMYNTNEPFVPEISEEFEKGFETNGSCIVFVTDEVEYVIPYAAEVIRTLRENGFTKKCMSIPFSTFAYPEGSKVRWEKLRKWAYKRQSTILK